MRVCVCENEVSVECLHFNVEYVGVDVGVFGWKVGVGDFVVVV